MFKSKTVMALGAAFVLLFGQPYGVEAAPQGIQGQMNRLAINALPVFPWLVVGATKEQQVLTYLREGFIDNSVDLPDYFASHIHAGHRRVIDWYAPSVCGTRNNDDILPGYLDVWAQIEAQLPPPLLGFVHADFHRGNLRLINNTCGVLDFQGAQWGPLAYDLVNLLDDARAVTPGTYQVPVPQVESMYVPQWRATGATEGLLIVRP